MSACCSGNCHMEAGVSPEEVTPRSSGCSSKNDVPELTAASIIFQEKRTNKFPSSQSRFRFPSNQGNPQGYVDDLSGFGPGDVLQFERLRLNVLHGGVTKTTSNSRARVFSSKLFDRASSVMSCNGSRMISTSVICSVKQKGTCISSRRLRMSAWRF